MPDPLGVGDRLPDAGARRSHHDVLFDAIGADGAHGLLGFGGHVRVFPFRESGEL